MSKLLVERGTPAEQFNAVRAVKFVKEEIILPFGSPKFVLSDNDIKFHCKAADNFATDQQIQWKNTATYSPQSNGNSERMVSTIERAL